MNYMPEIAKMLGVEIGEEFNVFHNRENIIIGRCRFTNEKMEMLVNGSWVSTYSYQGVIEGYSRIEKIPFEPKNGDLYYFVSWSILTSNRSIYTIQSRFSQTSGCAANKYCGNCFRTEADAEREKYNVYKNLTGREWEE